MSIFRVGQKVTLKDRKPWHSLPGDEAYDLNEPEFGQVYRVTGITHDKSDSYLMLGGFRDEYHSVEFRPVVEKKTDISIFKEILAGTRQPVGVEA